MIVKDSGWINARIEFIGTGKNFDVLYISNRKSNLLVFCLFNGYTQLGVYKVVNPHLFFEGQNVFVKRGFVLKKFLFFKFKQLDVVDVKIDDGGVLE